MIAAYVSWLDGLALTPFQSQLVTAAAIVIAMAVTCCLLWVVGVAWEAVADWRFARQLDREFEEAAAEEARRRGRERALNVISQSAADYRRSRRQFERALDTAGDPKAVWPPRAS